MRIIGTGSYFPQKSVTNEELSQMVDTSDAWIRQRVGIRSRHIATNETTAEMAAEAAKKALAAANMDASELDLIIAATMSADMVCPTVAGEVQSAIGANCPAFDLNSACSGFLFALDTAESFLVRGSAHNVLVIGAERMSKLLNWEDRSTCVIFGDGAGAAVVTAGNGYLASRLHTEGNASVITVPAPLGNSPFFTHLQTLPYVQMNGQETFRFAVKRMTEDVLAVTAQAGIKVSDLKYIVPHQANQRILDFAVTRLGIPAERMFSNIETCGNTSAASAAIALDAVMRSGNVSRGDYLVLCAFGGGLSSAACVIQIE